MVTLLLLFIEMKKVKMSSGPKLILIMIKQMKMYMALQRVMNLEKLLITHLI